jgi:curli production assembly/transport component CsgF
MNKFKIGCYLFFLIFNKSVLATELTHRFINPNFVGSPQNGSFMQNQADNQNLFKAPSANASNQTPIDSFKQSLQRAILSRVQNNATQSLFDSNGNVVLGKSLNFDLTGDGLSAFSITVDNAVIDGNANITITDGITSTILTIPYFETKAK